MKLPSTVTMRILTCFVVAGIAVWLFVGEQVAPGIDDQLAPLAEVDAVSDARSSASEGKPLERTPVAPERSDVKESGPGYSASEAPLSVAEQAEKVMRQSRGFGKRPKNETFHSEDTVSSVVADMAINPEEKTLTPEQHRELAELVKQYNELWDSSIEIQDELHADASLQALKMGQFVTEPLTNSDKKNRDLVKEKKQFLTDRLGKELVDWRCDQVWWTSMGGESRVVLAWYTVVQNPHAFEAADAIMTARQERTRGLKRFFANL